MRHLKIFGLFALLQILAWAASHFFFQQNQREILVVVDTSYSMKSEFGKVRTWIDNLADSSRYKHIVIGTDKAMLGPLNELESRDIIFRTAFGKLNTEKLDNLYSDSRAVEKILLTNSSVADDNWTTIVF